MHSYSIPFKSHHLGWSHCNKMPTAIFFWTAKLTWLIIAVKTGTVMWQRMDDSLTIHLSQPKPLPKHDSQFTLPAYLITMTLKTISSKNDSNFQRYRPPI